MMVRIGRTIGPYTCFTGLLPLKAVTFAATLPAVVTPSCDCKITL
jgi:hypothetical protein